MSIGFIIPLFCAISSLTAQMNANLVDIHIWPSHRQITQNTHVVLGLEFVLHDNWHLFWQNPGEAGLPLRANVHSQVPVMAHALQWPTPEILTTTPLLTYGYRGRTMLQWQIDFPQQFDEDYRPKTKLKLTLQLHFLLCDNLCIPQHISQTLWFLVSDREEWLEQSQKLLRSNAPYFPQIWQTSQPLSALITPAWLQLSWSLPDTGAHEQWAFVPQQASWLAASKAASYTYEGHRWHMRVPAASLPKPIPTQIGGLLLRTSPLPSKAYRIDTGLTQAAQLPATPISGGIDGAMGLIWLTAFLGGLLLNVMPCVLPSLGLKMLALLKMRQDTWRIWSDVLSYTAGILVAFWALSGILLGLRHLGQQHLAWGFQLQSKSFVLFLLFLLLSMALNLFGLLEIGQGFSQLGGWLPRQQSNLAAFLHGLLLTFIATPCSAPFTTSALAAALVQPAPMALAIMTCLGLGLASPMLLVAMFPRALQLLPAPGAWLVAFRQGLGFVLLGVCWWLMGLLASISSLDSMVFWGFMLLGWALAVFIAQHGLRSRLQRFGWLTTWIVVIGAMAVSNPSRLETWLDYSPGLVQRLQAQKRGVLLDVTAKWCLTCQVNEQVSLRHSQVLGLVHRKNIAMVKADWTRSNPDITELIQSFGREGIPLVVVYPADPKQPPTVLPDLLTPGLVMQALEKL